MKISTKGILITVASTFAFMSVSCQEDKSLLDPPTYSEFHVKSETVKNPPETTTTSLETAKSTITTSAGASSRASSEASSEEATTPRENTYSASLDRIIEDGKVVSTNIISPEITVTTTTATFDIPNADSSTIESDVVNNSTIESDTVDSSIIENNTVNSGTIESNAVDSTTIESDTVDNDTIESDTIDSSTIENNTVDSGIIENNTVSASISFQPQHSDLAEILQQYPESENSASIANNYYIVNYDDSFWSISEYLNETKHLNIPTEHLLDFAKFLAEKNEMSLSDIIHPGDVLNISCAEEYCNFVSTDSCEDYPSYEDSCEEYPSYEESSEAYPSYEESSETYPSYEESSEAYPSYEESSEAYPSYEESSEAYPSYEESSEAYPSYEESSEAYDILNTIKNFETEYVGINIGMGIYSLSGTPLFEYNVYSPISGACTVKAPYAAYVLRCCESEGIDIWSETLIYQPGMINYGSGEIKNAPYGSEYTIARLLTLLLSISDNTAYNILVSRFPLSGYQVFLDGIGGQQLNGVQYGTVSVSQRKNEWLYIYNYINSDSYYSETLRQMLSNTPYCYLVEGMANYHNYLHKSGWCDGSDYTSASDCAIVDNRYLVIVLSQDYRTGIAHTDVVNVLGLEAEIFMS